MERHTPVLVDEIRELVAQQRHTTVLDATIGTGGHAEVVLNTMQGGTFVGIDADSGALQEAQTHLASYRSAIDLHFIKGNFRDAEALVKTVATATYTFILADLGWGSHQLKNGKGFSFATDEVLNMCYGDEGTCPVTALEIVNTFQKDELRTLIAEYGEERWALRIAERIVEERKHKPITTSKELALCISKAIPRALQGHLHPATKTFQALRIVVNDELGALKAFLSVVPTLLTPNGTLAIITFHSLEDRIVKQTFRSWEREGVGERLSKKGIQPTDAECQRNPRSRSATLRTFTKN